MCVSRGLIYIEQGDATAMLCETCTYKSTDGNQPHLFCTSAANDPTERLISSNSSAEVRQLRSWEFIAILLQFYVAAFAVVNNQLA